MRTLPLALFAILASPVSAQSFIHKASEFSLGADKLEGQGILSDFDSDAIFLSARSDFALSPTFGLQGNLHFDRVNSDDGTFDQSTLSLHGYYELSGGNRVGLFLQRRSMDFGEQSYTDDSYGIEAIWSVAPQISIEAYLGAGEAGVNSGPSVDEKLWGLRGDYDVTDALGLHLSYDYAEFNDSQRITDTRIGADYSFAGGGSAVPLVVSFEYGIYDLDVPENFNRYTLRLTVPLGTNGGSSRRKLFHNRGALSNIFPIS